jgi:hypothetical protein
VPLATMVREEESVEASTPVAESVVVEASSSFPLTLLLVLSDLVAAPSIMMKKTFFSSFNRERGRKEGRLLFRHFNDPHWIYRHVYHPKNLWS